MAGGTVIPLKSQIPKASFLRITSKPQPNLNLHHRLPLIPTLKNKKDNKICKKNRKKALIGCKINSKISPKALSEAIITSESRVIRTSKLIKRTKTSSKVTM